MEFMMGIYDVDRSGDTDRTRIRGSGRIVGSSVGLLEVDGCEIRFMSVVWIRFPEKWDLKRNSTHSKVLS